MYGEAFAPRVASLPTFPRKASLQADRPENGGWLSERTSIPRPASEKGPIDWAALLDLTQQIQHQGQPGPVTQQAERTPVVQTAVELQEYDLTEADSHENALSFEQEMLEQREATALSDSFDLRAEVKQIQTASEAIKWMRERIFSRSDPESLINRIEAAQEVPSPKLLATFPHLLTDLINLLREVSPDTALLPLRQAAQHSAKSYLYGCTKSVYHAALRALWEKFGDIEGCLHLLEEMERGGVNFGSATVDMMTRVSDTVSADILNAQEKVNEELHDEAQSDTLDDEVRGWSILRERERDAMAEQYMFFSNAQRRAVGKIDKLMTASRARAIAATNKENMLEDMIRQSHKISRDFGTEDSAPSHVNQIIDSYGRMRKTINWMTPYESPFDMQQSAARGRQRTHGRSTTRTATRGGLVTRRERPARSEDILSMAVDEVSAATARSRASA